MRIVDVMPGYGKKNPMRCLTWITAALFSTLLLGCSTPPRKAEPDRLAPPLIAEDLALIERLQSEYAMQQGDRAAAADRLGAAAMLSDLPLVSLSALRAALLANRLEAARALYARFTTLSKDDPAAPAYAAALALASGDSVSAHAAADQLGTGADGRRRLAEALRWLSIPERVMPFVFDRAERSAALDDWLHWSSFARDRRDHEASQRIASAAVQRFPDQARAYEFRGALLREIDADAALVDLETALRLDPKSRSIRMALAHQFDVAGDAARAADVIAGIDPADDVSLAAEIGFAAKSGSAEALDKAYQHLKTLAEPHPAERLMLLGQIAEVLSRHDDALRFYQQVQGEERSAARMRTAVLNHAAGRHQEALEQLRSLRADGLLQRDPLAQTYLLEAEIVQVASGTEAAIAVFDQALRVLPDDDELMYSRALLFAELSRYAEMERDLLRLIELDPENADALNAYGYTLVDRNIRLDEAEQYLRRAEKLTPDSGALQDSLGWLAFRRGDLALAERHLRAAALGINDPEVSAHLGEVLWQRGDRDAARKVWDEAAARDPKHRVLLETRRRLDP